METVTKERTHCDRCGEKILPEPGRIGSGYGVDPETDETVCYRCCAVSDRDRMRRGEPITLYLTQDSLLWQDHTDPVTGEVRGHTYRHYLENWPGTLKIGLHRRPKKGCHNWARTRYDVWFRYGGHNWHGVQYGDNTQLCHCRVVK